LTCKEAAISANLPCDTLVPNQGFSSGLEGIERIERHHDLSQP
jgi:hypothetical protein